MSNIYCSNCGAKHMTGAKFCTNCGNSLGGYSNMQSKPQIQISKPNIRQIEQEVDEDGIPTTFVRPTKLAYEIEKPVSNKYSAKDLFNSAPVDPSEKQISRPNSNYRKLTKEEFLAESLRECSSRPMKDIDES